MGYTRLLEQKEDKLQCQLGTKIVIFHPLGKKEEKPSQIEGPVIARKSVS